nr:nephrin-like [Cherax quadricarinatus]
MVPFFVLMFTWTLLNTDGATLESINTGPLFMTDVVKGGRAEMPCDVVTADSSDRVVLVLWYKDGVGAPIYSYDSRKHSLLDARNWADEKTLGGRGHFDLQSSPASLVLDNVRASDEGLYRCRVDFKKSPTRNARTNLTVIIPPDDPVILTQQQGGAPVWTMVGPYNEGDTLSLTCEVSGGKPAPRVTWWMKGEMIDDTYESLGAHTVTNTLTLVGLSRAHLHAVLVCTASNSNHTAAVHTSITIEMNFKPLSVTILASREAVSAGKEYELACQSVGARPPASLTWWLDGVQLANTSISTASNGNVTLSKLLLVPSDADGGKFLKCLAESPVIDHQPLYDLWKLDVQYTPHVYLAMGSNLSPNEIKEGDDVYFECNVRAHPYVYKVLWYHNGVQVQHNVSAGVIVSNQSLVIQRVRRQQTGLYTCVASNIEGDGQSNAVVLRVQYAPVCASGQVHVYGAAKNEEVSVTCRLDAVPPVVHFFWRFNSSGDVVDIAENHVATQGLQSSLSYVARTDLDYGTLLCWGSNALGRQKIPCSYKVIAAGKPNPPENCNLTNQTTETLKVHCVPGYDGGLLQKFIMEVYEAVSQRLLLNITENSAPDFTLRGLEPGTSYIVHAYAANDRGSSEKRYLTGYTIKDVAERRTAPVRPPPEELVVMTPILAVVVGVVGSLVLVALVALMVVNLKKKRRPECKTVTLQLQTSLTDTRDLDEKNPDLIPANGNGGVQSQSPTTPEEGGFGSVHVCASVPYTTTHHLHTIQHKIRRNEELMYAELSLPRSSEHYPTTTTITTTTTSSFCGHYPTTTTSTSSFYRHRPDSTIYTQVEPALPGAPVSLGVAPVKSGLVSAGGLMGGKLGGSVVCVMGGNIRSSMGGSICGSTVGMGGNICPGNSIVLGTMCPQEHMVGTLDSLAFTTSPRGFGSNPVTQPMLSEEDDKATVDMPLVNDHKESEV